MIRLLRIPMERWRLLLVVEPHRPLVEAEALMLAGARQAGSLDMLAGGMKTVPWGLLASLADDGLLDVDGAGSVQLAPGLIGVTEPSKLVEAIRGSDSPAQILLTLYRDRSTGAWHGESAVDALEENPTHDEAHDLPVTVPAGQADDLVRPGAVSRSLFGSVEGLVRAALPVLRGLRLGSPRTLAQRTRIVAVESIDPCSVAVVFERRDMGDGWEHWLTRAEPSLTEVCVRAAQHLVLGRKIGVRVAQSWSPSPEVRVLTQCEVVARHMWHRRNDRDLTTDTRLTEEIKQIVHTAREALDQIQGEGEEVLRADRAIILPGTGFDQANALADIVRRTRRRALLISAFVALDSAVPMGHLMENGLPAGAELRCFHGHASELGPSEVKGEAIAFERALGNAGLAGRITVRPTKVKTHAKLIVNDNGDVWIGSWNALSGRPQARVTEVGLRLHGTAVAAAVLETVLEVVDDADRPFVSEILADLRSREGPRSRLRPEAVADVREALDWLEAWLPRRLDRHWDQRLENCLQYTRAWFSDVSERPRCRLVATNSHRAALLALVSGADHSVLLASDRVKTAGLDRQLIALLAQQPLKVEQKVRFELRVLWGRDDPGQVHSGQADTTAARGPLRELCGAIQGTRKLTMVDKRSAGPGAPGFAYDLYADLDRPMGSHAKAVQVDDERVLVTSANLLAFGDERSDTDSRELGILLDAPRQALLLRGELELAHVQLRARWDHTRWRVAFAESVRFVLEQCGTEEVPAGRAVNDMLRRCHGGDGERDEDLTQDMVTRLFQTGKGSRNGGEAILRLIDLASKNRFIVFDREELHAIRGESRLRDITPDISALSLRLPSSAAVWEVPDVGEC